MKLVTPDLTCFHTRRKQVFAWMHSVGGGIAIVPTAIERTRNRDKHYSYRHDSDFYYLSGFAEAQAWLELIAGDTDQSILFCEGGLGFFNSIAPAGKSTKVSASDNKIPILIIHPKWITGFMSQSISEVNPAMVVSVANRHGTNLD